ncbi:cellulose binding domain-containing protein [Paenibacillus campinasensis]|uniref:Xyloglucanase n=1 Tax=Paenibacillus campinasensis TaxID=66347 RepID=A0A268EZF1_9BACL|nr:cellulose binding domain-containing protein [Paenibacillus campinasensis]PAD78498.1 xyloglucanase [Paenibacillus campinasensis]
MGKSKKRFKRLFVLAIAIMLGGTSYPGFTSSSLAAASEPVVSEPYEWKQVKTGGGGGFIPGIVFNTSEPNLIYTRTDIGGAYRWDQDTRTWKQLLAWVGADNWSKSGVDALATDPVDPDRLYLAVGTYTNSWDPLNGSILRSTDRGETWEETELPFKVGGNMPGRSMGERLAIDPNKNSVLYFGARSGNGLWKSTDYGATWNQVSSFPNLGTYVENPDNEYQSDIVGLAWITFDPRTGSSGQATQTIYVGVADLNESVYRSVDGGVTWEAVPGQPSGYLPHHGVLSSDGFLYISYSDGVGPYDGTSGEVWKLNTSTGEWIDISPVPSSSSDNYFGYGGLAVDVQNPGTVMVASLNSWWPDAIIFRSTDGGSTWSRIWDWDGYPGRTLRYTQDISAAPWLDFGNSPIPPEVTPKLGWMIGDLEIDPFNSDRMMYGTGATIYGTDNLTEWDRGGKIDLKVMAEGIEETSVTALISPPSGAHLLSGLLDVTGFRHDNLNQAPAKMFTNPGETSDMDYAELDPGFIVRVGMVNRSENPNARAIGFSRDGGGNWYSAGEPAGTSGGGKIALSAHGDNLVWSTSDVGVHYSRGGNSWSASSGVPAGALVASDRVNSNLFYALAGGDFYVSRDGGATFAKTAAAGLPENGDLDLKAMPGREGDVWIASRGDNSGIWHSSDAGASFTKLTNVEDASVIGFGKAAPGRDVMALYTSGKIGGVRGFFRSDDGGANWVRINDDQHQYASTNTAITGDPRIYGRVYIGTNGYGIVYGDTMVTPQEPEEPEEPQEPQEPGQDASISPTSATFDLSPERRGDILVALRLNGNTIAGLYKGTDTLREGEDYTISGAEVTILQSFLAAQPAGDLRITFRFSAGADAELHIRVVDTTQTPAGSLRIEAVSGTQQPVTNTINPRIRLSNTGTEELALKDVTLRYYYTVDGDKKQNLFCDWTQVGSENVTARFVRMPEPVDGADYYAEIGFAEAAGTLAPGQTIDLNIRISKEDWSNYNQSDDYSFSRGSNIYDEALNITGYVNGELNWGLEP